jgi:hypothetical protein
LFPLEIIGEHRFYHQPVKEKEYDRVEGSHDNDRIRNYADVVLITIKYIDP